MICLIISTHEKPFENRWHGTGLEFSVENRTNLAVDRGVNLRILEI